MTCGLDFTPFRTRDEAAAKYNTIPGAFSITQISNDSRWWYILSKEGNTYKVNYSDGAYTVPATAGLTFNLLYSRLSDFQLSQAEELAEPNYYIEEKDLINNFIEPTPIAPKAIIKNIKNIVDTP